MLDGSDAIADWPLLNALVNTACGRDLGLDPPRRRRRHRPLHPRRAGDRRRRHGPGRAEDRAGAHQRPGHGRDPARRRRVRRGGRHRARPRRTHPDGRVLAPARRPQNRHSSDRERLAERRAEVPGRASACPTGHRMRRHQRRLGRGTSSEVVAWAAPRWMTPGGACAARATGAPPRRVAGRRHDGRSAGELAPRLDDPAVEVLDRAAYAVLGRLAVQHPVELGVLGAQQDGLRRDTGDPLAARSSCFTHQSGSCLSGRFSGLPAPGRSSNSPRSIARWICRSTHRCWLRRPLTRRHATGALVALLLALGRVVSRSIEPKIPSGQ